jgi:hypothetical protein
MQIILAHPEPYPLIKEVAGLISAVQAVNDAALASRRAHVLGRVDTFISEVTTALGQVEATAELKHASRAPPTYRYFAQMTGFCIRENTNLGKNAVDVLAKLFCRRVLPNRHLWGAATTNVQIFRPRGFRQIVVKPAEAFPDDYVNEIT